MSAHIYENSSNYHLKSKKRHGLDSHSENHIAHVHAYKKSEEIG